MRIKQTYRREGDATSAGKRAMYPFVREGQGPPQSLTLTERQFERLGKPAKVDVVIRASGEPATSG